MRVSPQENVIISLHSGYQKNIIHYKSPTLSITGSAGAELDVYGANRIITSNTAADIIPGISANIQTNQTIKFQTLPKNPMNPSLSGQIQEVEALGSTNEGERQGALSNPDPEQALLNSMKYTGFQLNQVNADASLNVPVKNNVSSISQAKYQGSNVGQMLKVTSGFQVVTNGGMKIFAFIGYVDENIKGYKTKSSLFTQPSGGITGGGMQTKGGTQISTDIQGIGGDEPVQGNIKVVVPIFNKSKKK